MKHNLDEKEKFIERNTKPRWAKEKKNNDSFISNSIKFVIENIPRRKISVLASLVNSVKGLRRNSANIHKIFFKNRMDVNICHVIL